MNDTMNMDVSCYIHHKMWSGAKDCVVALSRLRCVDDANVLPFLEHCPAPTVQDVESRHRRRFASI